jgi:hypothetical protein
LPHAQFKLRALGLKPFLESEIDEWLHALFMHHLVTVADYVPVESANGIGVAWWQPIGLLLRQVFEDVLQMLNRKAQ